MALYSPLYQLTTSFFPFEAKSHLAAGLDPYLHPAFPLSALPFLTHNFILMTAYTSLTKRMWAPVGWVELTSEFPAQPTFFIRPLSVGPVPASRNTGFESLEINNSTGCNWIQDGPRMSWGLAHPQSSIYSIFIQDNWNKQVWMISLGLLMNVFISRPGSHIHLNTHTHTPHTHSSNISSEVLLSIVMSNLPFLMYFIS